MNIEELQKRLKEIDEKLQEIMSALDDASETEDVEALEKEADELTEKRNGLIKSIERRNANLETLRNGTAKLINKPQSSSRKIFDIGSIEYRNAWAKSLMYQRLNEDESQALYEVNQRALDTAFTTTSETFVSPAVGVDRVNNGGLFIPQTVSDKLLAEIALASPILADVFQMAVPGMMSFPYKKQSTGAKWVEEGKDNDDKNIEWGTLALQSKELSTTIKVTWKLEAMTPDAFINYIINELRFEMIEALSTSVIYGAGGLDIQGISKTDLTVTYLATDNLIDKIVNAVSKIPKKKRIGAILYISDTLSRKIILQKNTNGDYVLPPLNGSALNSLGTMPVKVDLFLEDEDFIVGNLKQGYILNQIEPVTITKDVSGKNRVNDYTAYGIWGGAVVPSTVVYGTGTLPAGLFGETITTMGEPVGETTSAAKSSTK